MGELEYALEEVNSEAALKPMESIKDNPKNLATSASSNKRKLDNKHAETKKRKNEKSNKYKQPTPEELNNFRELDNLYNSYMLKSELEDLVKSNTYVEAKAAAKRNEFEKWFTQLSNCLKNKIKVYGSLKTSEFLKKAIKSNNGKSDEVQLLINRTHLLTKYYTVCDDGNTVSWFIRPEGVYAYGGFKSGDCGGKADFIPKVVVTMPRDAFYAKDFLNNRYLVKRFHYLIYLMHELKKEPFISYVKIDDYQNNGLLKVLRIIPSYDSNETIQLFVVPEEGVFKTARMQPNQNNFKVNVYRSVKTRFCGKFFKAMDISGFVNKGSVMYNTLLLHDFTLQEHNVTISKILLDHTCCHAAIKMLLIWLKKRQLNTDYTSFTKELLTYTIVYLINTKKINTLMSSYQVVRIFFIFINETDWRVNPISLSSAKELADCKDNFDVVFTDFTGIYNIAGFLDASTYGKLKFEAAKALEILNKDVFRAFMSLFRDNMSPVLQYDCIVNFHDKNSFKTLYDKFISDEIKWKYFGFYELLIKSQLIDLLKYGLGERVEQIVPLQFDLKEFKSTQCFVFGLKLNQSNALNPLIIGPQQYDPEATKFKQFWGDLVSLRRFRNTSIHEAVFFDKSKTVADKRNICAEIIEFIAKKVNVDFNVVSNQFEQLISLPHMQLPFEHGTNEEATKLVQVAMDDLFKIVRELTFTDGSISMIQSVSDVFCGTDPFPPIATNYSGGKKVTTTRGNNILLRDHKNATISPRYVPVIECVMHINLDKSAAVDSIDLYKATLAKVYYDVSAALSATPNIISKPDLQYVDVLFKGLVFRLRGYNDREVALLKKTEDSLGQVAYKTTPDSVEAERKGIVEPAVYGALNGLYRRFPCYGAATAIAKRWLRSQLLHSGHINDMTINLLVAAVFVSPEPFDVPTLPQVAFFRFLRLLAEFPFDQLPVVLNFNDELKREDISRVDNEFVEKRESYNTIHILMLYDNYKSVFTAKSPIDLFVRRMKIMAVDSLLSINKCINTLDNISPERFCVPNLDGYSLNIELLPTLNPKRHLNVVNILQKLAKPVSVAAHDKHVETKMPVVVYSPADNYLRILEKNFGCFAYFFHDTFGGDSIHVLWNMEGLKTKDFKISNVPGLNLVDNKLEFDVEAVTADLIVLAGGLVNNVEENASCNFKV